MSPMLSALADFKAQLLMLPVGERRMHAAHQLQQFSQQAAIASVALGVAQEGGYEVPQQFKGMIRLLEMIASGEKQLGISVGSGALDGVGFIIDLMGEAEVVMAGPGGPTEMRAPETDEPIVDPDPKPADNVVQVNFAARQRTLH
jgi:hypothetical protein